MIILSRTPCGVHTAVPRFCEDMRRKSKKEKEMEKKKKKNQKKTRETNTKKNKKPGGFNRSAHSAEPSRGEVARSEGNDDNSNSDDDSNGNAGIIPRTCYDSSKKIRHCNFFSNFDEHF